jgi:hypothetical protein
VERFERLAGIGDSVERRQEGGVGSTWEQQHEKKKQ